MSDARVNLFGLSREGLEGFFAGLGEKPFRARQLMTWMYRFGNADFATMTDISKALRTRLAEIAEIRTPEIRSLHDAGDGTRKWMLSMDGGQAIETVFIPEPARGTLCISSQVGCAMDCSFCATGKQGFNRNLSAADIVGQVWLANRELGYRQDGDRIITNVVFMGMGEPLANYRQVLPAIRVLIDDFGFNISRRRVTVSTSGLVPQIDRLAEDCNVALAVSLHAADDALRDALVPINRRHPIEELLEACWRYAERGAGRHITFEYVMLDGVNDGEADMRRLAKLLANRPAKVNLIPFNPFPGTDYRRSPLPVIERCRDQLLRKGVRTTIRRTRGDDIDAACGQLAGQVNDRMRYRLGNKLVSISARAS
ncbi:23S rRNA (adenine(2503)-C(2))-methyltransferase RlmN [Wenzhouxiangella sp. XN24]|uniref:23S rRNA (adenine(2503)-C(2))-methyltransferase RlmN n=1 Tax=Wenzhouxiangella sp. XN24 TaxID=2713569 RepID=UPI0013EBA6A1|nr:23S rRNA (adenine(2503)-C(2))-methyltransferase RlmN [Wenzhouxiangella sp. XN24]NGX14808.1 23S rRNA (adenine(2503)-C(2))-methyltransferase RlmN [Wenzhouxiangella sp. XN24]